MEGKLKLHALSDERNLWIIGKQRSTQLLNRKHWEVEICKRVEGASRVVGCSVYDAQFPGWKVSGKMIVREESVDYTLCSHGNSLKWIADGEVIGRVTISQRFMRSPNITLVSCFDESEYSLIFPRVLDTWRRRVNTRVRLIAHQKDYWVCPFPIEGEHNLQNENSMPFFDESLTTIGGSSSHLDWMIIGTALIGYGFYYP